MNILTLDISTSLGYALVQGKIGDPNKATADKKPTILEKGTRSLERTILSYAGGRYPWNYQKAADLMVDKIKDLYLGLKDQYDNIDVVVIEETNLGRDRYAQKILEWIHKGVVDFFEPRVSFCGLQVVYLSSSAWRQALGLVMSKDDKKNNSKLSKARARAKIDAQVQGITYAKALSAIKKEMGIRGKVDKKTVAIRYVNDLYGLGLKKKDDDVADAICLALAFLNNAVPCDGV